MLRSMFMLLVSVSLLASFGDCSEKLPVQMLPGKLADISGGIDQYCVIVISPDPNGQNCYDCEVIAGGSEKCDSADVDETWDYISGMDPANIISFDEQDCGGMLDEYTDGACSMLKTQEMPVNCTRQVTQDGGSNGAPGVNCP